MEQKQSQSEGSAPERPIPIIDPDQCHCDSCDFNRKSSSLYFRNVKEAANGAGPSAKKCLNDGSRNENNFPLFVLKEVDDSSDEDDSKSALLRSDKLKMNPMTMLNENVARAFNDFQLIKPTALQSAVWKKLFRGMNVTIVSEAGTGKTLCYLPVLLSKLKDEIDECRSERRSTKLMQKQICPFAVIVCPNVVQLFSLLVTIYKFELRDVNFNYLLSPISKHLAAVHDRSSVYLLLCTPRALAEAIESQFVDFRFLKMLVFESMSLLNDQQIFDCNSLVLDLKSKLDFHGVEEPLQFVFVSDVWLPVIQRWQERWQMNIDHNLASQIEACLFRGHRFDLQFCRNDNEKETVLIERLRRLSVRDKVFIVTNDDGVFPNIAHILEQNAIQFSKIEDDFEMKQIDDLHAEWEAQPNSPKVVLVSDFSVHLFPVSDITLIINYELPKFYDRFQSRFSVLCCDMNDYSKKRPICDILILFDETKPKIEAFRLLNLLKRMDGYKGQALQQYDQIIQDFETEKDVKKGQLCFSFMVTGQCAVTCANYICRRSHHFIADPNDFLSNQYPSKGCVQFEIVEVLSPSQFAVRVSKAFDENGDEVSIQTVYDNGYLVAHELSKIQSKLNKKDKSLKCVGFKDLRVGNDYVYAYKGCFVRVKLINIHENMSVDLLVTDRGIELYNKKCEQMYELKGVLRSAQAQVVTVVLANLVPYNKEDSNYCLHCERIFSDVVKTYTTRKSQYFFQGNILLKYGSIFWLDDVQIYSQTSEKTLPITIFSFRNYLIREKMSRYDSSNLKRISEKVKVAINNVSITQTCVDPEKPKHVQWAFLPDNPFTGTQVDIITFEETCTFYVRISVFTKLLLTLEDEINADSLLLRAVHFKDNNYYLAKSAIDKRYHRAYVAAGALAHDGVVSCRFVDSGRKEDVNLDELRSLDQYYVSRLPFQAIRCRLFGLHVVAPVTCDISDSIVARNPMMAYCNSLESETETTALFSGLSYAVVLSSDTETLNVVLPTQFPTCFQTNTNESFIEIHQAPDNQNISTIAECNDDDEDDDDNEIRPSTGILDRNWSENEDNNGDGNSVAYPDDPTFFSCDFDDGDWDVNICDINEFAEHAKKAFNENKMQEKTDELKKPSSSRSPLKELTLYPKIKDDDSLFPTIKWGQSDKLIELNIKILYAFDTKVKIDKNRTDFRFESKSKNETKPYRFNFCLFSSVSRAFKIIESSFEVVVKLKKHTFAEHWDSLTQNDHIYKNWLSRACLSHSRPKDGDCSESDAEDDMGVGVGVGAFTGPSKSKIPTMSEDLKNALKSCGPDKDELIVEQNSDYDSCSDYSDTDAED